MISSHLIKSWSSTQTVIALSSGDAEYYGMVKAAAQGIGAKAMLLDFGIVINEPIEVKSDASAAIGIAQRRGMGKVRHIETNQLWLH
jgi:Fe2+ transport system protein FeoA